MAGVWSDVENDVIVDIYFTMLKIELSSGSYVKAEYNREAQRRLNNRGHASVEFKLQNVSAVLREMNFPFIQGYKPAVNFQGSLRDAVGRRLAADEELAGLALRRLSRGLDVPIRADFHWNLVDPPVMEFSPESERLRRAAKVDFAEIEANNRALGQAGEALVVSRERELLRKAGQHGLASKVEHVSVTQGDGLGFDILSYSPDGVEKYIEVKSTRLSRYWPAVVSGNEVRFSEEEREKYHLYRVFELDERRAKAGLFVVRGSLSEHWTLYPLTYRAQPRVTVKEPAL